MMWIIVVLAIIAVYVIAQRNSFASMEVNIQNGMAEIDNQLKRRHDLIPNLVSTVKGYAKHEKELFEDISKARAGLLSSDMSEKMQATSETSALLGRLLAISEAYPDLKANTSFERLQVELVGTEDKLAYARKFYNSLVSRFNQKVVVFPSNIIAGMFSYQAKMFFEVSEVERASVKVEF